MSNNKSLFGWQAVINSYSWKNFFIDSIFPIIASALIVLGTYKSSADFLSMLNKIIDMSLSITPTILGFLIAAYTIALSFFLSDKVKEIKDSEEGKVFIESMNAGFSVSLFVSAITIVVIIFINCICEMKIESSFADWVNGVAIFFVLYLVLFSITNVVGTIIDLFNSGQTSLL